MKKCPNCGSTDTFTDDTDGDKQKLEPLNWCQSCGYGWSAKPLNIDETRLYIEELTALKSRGYKLRVPQNKIFKHNETALLATKETSNGQIQIFGHFAPAHFFTIYVPTVDNKTFALATGSGSLDKHLFKLDTAIELIQSGMLEVHQQEKPQTKVE